MAVGAAVGAHACSVGASGAAIAETLTLRAAGRAGSLQSAGRRCPNREGCPRRSALCRRGWATLPRSQLQGLCVCVKRMLYCKFNECCSRENGKCGNCTHVKCGGFPQCSSRAPKMLPLIQWGQKFSASLETRDCMRAEDAMHSARIGLPGNSMARGGASPYQRPSARQKQQSLEVYVWSHPGETQACCQHSSRPSRTSVLKSVLSSFKGLRA